MDFPDTLTDDEMKIRLKECKVAGIFAAWEEAEGVIFVNKQEKETIVGGYAWLDGVWRKMPMDFLSRAFGEMISQLVGENMTDIMKQFNKHTHATPHGYPYGTPTHIPLTPAGPISIGTKVKTDGLPEDDDST